MKKTKKEKQRPFGIVTFDYPFEGYILINGPRRDLGKFKEILMEEEICLRTEKLIERLSSMENNLVFPGYLGGHCAGDFRVEVVNELTPQEVREYEVPATWGENWVIDTLDLPTTMTD